jgi:hypothetical protein
MRRPCRGEPAVIRQLVSPIHNGVSLNIITDSWTLAPVIGRRPRRLTAYFSLTQ